MNELLNTVFALRKELKKIDDKECKSLEKLLQTLSPVLDLTSEFESAWIGGWGQNNYDHYLKFDDSQEPVQVNNQYFYDIIESKTNVNLDNIDKEIRLALKPFEALRKHLITELSVIRDKENFKNENEILNSIEDFKWGITVREFIKQFTPTKFFVRNLNILNKGILTPPHISVTGYIFSLSSECIAVKNFSDLANRVLRQIELKFANNSPPDGIDYTERILNNLFDNFHIFYNQLKHRHDNRPSIEINDEYDVQDILHSLLKLHFKDVREEENSPSFAATSSRMDFLLKKENIVIEVKKTREKLADKQIGEQLILDVAYYRNHPNCKSLKCFVYDPDNRIKNPRGVESDINKLSDDSILVELYVRP